VNADVAVTAVERFETPLLAVPVPKCGKELPAPLAALDERTGGLLSRLCAAGEFAGTRDEVAVAHAGGAAAGRVMLVGLGAVDRADRSAIRRAAAVAARRMRSLGGGAFAFAVPREFRGEIGPFDVAQSAIEGAEQGAWSFEELKSATAPDSERKPPVSALTVLVEPSEEAEARRGLGVGLAVAAAHVLARRLQALPPNHCTPTHLAEVAGQLAATHGFAITVLDRAAIAAEGMGGLVAVSQGSGTEPRFIVLEYKGAGDAAPVVLVGKGITFDSGGISIKPSQGMGEMKYDMSGAAAVLGAMDCAGRLGLRLNVAGVIPSTDNMPDGLALRPSDVVRGHSGKTIEIVDTDAEGRLILADALSYAGRFNPAAVLDAATLTGGAVICLGHTASAVMGNDETLVEEVRRAGERSGERAWQLPMFDDYRELNKSDVADLKNSGGRPAQTISAGWFLREFVKGYPWAHVDVAGTAYASSDAPPLPKGPAGVPTRLFCEFLLGRAG